MYFCVDFNGYQLTCDEDTLTLHQIPYKILVAMIGIVTNQLTSLARLLSVKSNSRYFRNIQSSTVLIVFLIYLLNIQGGKFYIGFN